VRTVGGVVAIVDGALVSIWDVEVPEPYKTVAAIMSELVKSGSIDNVVLHTERSVGTAKNFQQVTGLSGPGTDSGVITWNHFHINLPTSACAAKADIGPKLSDYRATHDVLKRGLEELTLDSVDTVLELIAQNSLYRGEESKFALEGFHGLLTRYAALPRDMGQEQDLFIWLHSTVASATNRIRNTAIGTLLIDLSAGAELEDAVRKFETSIMAPANYKRPTALVSKAMIEKARLKIDELGLASALERRYAVPEDVTVANVLFASRGKTTVLSGQRGGSKTLSANAAFSELTAAIAENPRSYDKVEEIGIEKFLTDVLPKSKGLEVLLENRHAGNLVSLVAPSDPTAERLFKWPNAFSWSYAGEMADSIKERVKRAGGSVTGDLCCRLAWDYEDDLDFHMKEPGGQSSSAAKWMGSGSGSNHIYYDNVRRLSASGGMLDLDANGRDGRKAEPAENIFYADRMKMAEGMYELIVNNYARRSTGVGFEAEVEFEGQTFHFTHDKAMRTSENITVAKIQFTRKDGFKIIESMPSTQSSKAIWGLKTQTFQKASMVMLSPNYWSNEVPGSSQASHAVDRLTGEWSGVGNKHWFFMLEGCANEGAARPFYNEMLRSDLEPHRKTLEMVGAKLRTDEATRQLSGIGFSSTKHDSLTVRVTGSIVRVLKVVF
jgi:hypothetical protein